VSTSSAAFRNPKIILEMLKEPRPEKVVVAIDVDRNASLPSGYEVFVDGGRTATGKDAMEWARQVDGYGVRCILPTSKATDGARTGFDLPLIRMIASNTKAEVVASGGAGTMEHFRQAAEAGATVLLAASVFHFGTIPIPGLKKYLQSCGINVNSPPAA
jgi:cyclase